VATQSIARIGSYLGMAKEGWLLRRGETDEAKERARRHLVDRMGRMRGLPQKLGQILGFSHRDGEAAQAYETLQDQAQPLPISRIRSILEEEWGEPLDRVSASFAAAANAASLGQVHRAVLLDGREVAVKVQYPGIHQAILLDLKMLGWLNLPVGNLDRGFDVPGYRDAILKGIEQELDYRQEAENQRAFSTWATSNPFLDVPEVVDQWSTSKVLVSRWEEGDHWRDVQRSWTKQEKQRLAQGLVEFFHESIFQRGLLHADWHPGNLRFRRCGGDVRLLLYDFGSIYQPSEDDRMALLRLIRATCRQDEAPYGLFMKLGFRDEYLQAMHGKLPALCKVLLEPYVGEYPYDLKNWRLGQRVGDILGDDRWNFRIAGPPSLILLLRAFHGLIYYLEGLGVSTAWSRVIQPLFDQFDDQLNRLQLPAHHYENDRFEGLAKNLTIRVSENGLTKVQITHRAAAIDHLQTLIDDSVKERIESKGINLDEVVSDVRRRCYAPGDVFRLTEGTKEIAVWLQ